MKVTNTIQKTGDFITRKIKLNADDKILVAISGGIDSVVMADILIKLGYQVGLAHCNFQLRGEEADKDEALVENLAKQLNVPFYHTTFETEAYAKQQGISIQMAARDLRYEWLEKMRKKEGYYFIATAHHQNDNAETLLLNLTKGTGIAGLHGILPKQGNVIRPLLGLNREEIENYALENDLTYREDASNADNKYERNKLRLEVIPLLEKINPKLIATFNDNIERFKEVEAIYQLGLSGLKKKLVQHRKDGWYIPLKKLETITAKSTFLYEVLKEFGFDAEQVAQINDSIEKQPGLQFLSKEYRVIRDRDFLIITALADVEATGPVIVQEGQTKVKVGSQVISLKRITRTRNFQPNEKATTAQLDYVKLHWPLFLRPWKRGDYLYPLGMQNKKKKVSDLLTDNKLSVLEKENTWVLLSGEKIGWVLAQRMDERFKVTDTTTEILEIQLKQS